MAMVRPDDWRPLGIPSLEPEAERAVRSTEHTVVVAGPGAGKTELLAQRACYLLQTRICPIPRRILAISFKRDAAKNLRERVQRRCGEDIGHYFDSLTFDAFAKGLVDRFRLALPVEFRPTPDYAIVNYGERDVGNFLEALIPPPHIGTRLDIAALSRKTFLKEVFHRYPLTREQHTNLVAAWAASELWHQSIQAKPASRLTFPMIGRLAGLLLHTNPLLLRALRHTYAFVFLDEFQDTTRVQFDLTRTAFEGASAVLTAVGDNKQRIMGWAEALENAFDEFAAIFPGQRRQLKMNYRSAPRLVQIQEHLIRAIDADSAPPEAADDGSTGEGECRVLVFPNHKAEAKYLSNLAAELLKAAALSPRDICVIVKQRADVYASELIDVLRTQGIRARIESEVQDLLAEPVIDSLLPFMRLAAGERLLWPTAADLLARFRHGYYDEDAMPAIESELAAFIAQCRVRHTTPGDLPALSTSVIEFLQADTLKAQFPQYAQGRYLTELLERLHKQLTKAADGATTLLQAIDCFEGENSIPIMTIHKSKGLEYHTVIFLGLEDDAFWSFKTQSAEDTCSFFVAFSRAKKQVLFTFANARVSRQDERPKLQAKKTIGVLYDLLLSAGVTQEAIV